MPFLVRGPSTSRVPLHAGAHSPVVAPLTGKRPAALPAVLRSDGPSGHPLAFDAVAGAYLAPGSFSPGPGGLHQFQCNPSLRAAVITPPESVVAISQRSSTTDAAFTVPLAARLPDLIITGLAQRSMPAARSVAPRPHRRVRQEVPRRAFATPTCLLSFTAPWPLPCRDFHSLGHTAFLWSRSGTRSSTGCSRTSRRTGGVARWSTTKRSSA